MLYIMFLYFFTILDKLQFLTHYLLFHSWIAWLRALIINNWISSCSFLIIIPKLSSILSTVKIVLILMLIALVLLFGANCYGVSKVNFYLLTQTWTLIFIFILVLALCYISHQFQVFYYCCIHTCLTTIFQIFVFLRILISHILIFLYCFMELLSLNSMFDLHLFNILLQICYWSFTHLILMLECRLILQGGRIFPIILLLTLFLLEFELSVDVFIILYPFYFLFLVSVI